MILEFSNWQTSRGSFMFQPALRRNYKADETLKLDLAGWKRLILHDNGAAGGQNHDVELLLPFMGLLVPLASDLSVVGGDQRHLKDNHRVRCEGGGEGTQRLQNRKKHQSPGFL